jgi:DNA-binding response OmpR family regulator
VVEPQAEPAGALPLPPWTITSGLGVRAPENLAADSFRVAGATSAAEALRAIEVRQPALIVLDLKLEGGSGLDVLDSVRSADGLASRLDPDLPVIVLTGRSGEADRVRSFARGADDYLSKPLCHLFSAL